MLVGVERPDQVHVCRHVTGRRDQRTEAADLRRVVEVAAQDRHLGAVSDPVEARLPVVGATACALGRDDECEVVPLGECVGHLGDQSVRLAPRDRNTTEPFQEPSHRTPEQALLAEPMDRQPGLERHQHHEWEVPVRGVWCCDQHEPVRRRWFTVGAPAHEAEEAAGESLAKGHAVLGSGRPTLAPRWAGSGGCVVSSAVGRYRGGVCPYTSFPHDASGSSP